MENTIYQNIYKVAVRRGLGSGDWKDFTKVIFEVSVDNKRYTGPYFFSILSWAKERFDSIEIIVCDTLQRYNLAFAQNTDHRTAMQTAMQMGEDWIRRSQGYFDYLNICPRISRWEDWLSHDPKTYDTNYRDLVHLYQNNLAVRTEVDKLAEAVWESRRKIFHFSEALEQKFKEEVFFPYFFEETALSAVFLPEVGGISAYPGSLPNFWNNFIEGKFSCLKGFQGCTFVNLSLTRK